MEVHGVVNRLVAFARENGVGGSFDQRQFPLVQGPRPRASGELPGHAANRIWIERRSARRMRRPYCAIPPCPPGGCPVQPCRQVVPSAISISSHPPSGDKKPLEGTKLSTIARLVMPKFLTFRHISV
jgi:hypothetical protein